MPANPDPQTATPAGEMMVTQADIEAGAAADDGAIAVARALSARDCGALQSEMREARKAYLAEAFARHRLAHAKEQAAGVGREAAFVAFALRCSANNPAAIGPARNEAVELLERFGIEPRERGVFFHDIAADERNTAAILAAAPASSVGEGDFRSLVFESLYHLRLDDAAKRYHEKAMAALNATPDRTPEHGELASLVEAVKGAQELVEWIAGEIADRTFRFEEKGEADAWSDMDECMRDGRLASYRDQFGAALQKLSASPEGEG